MGIPIIAAPITLEIGETLELSSAVPGEARVRYDAIHESDGLGIRFCVRQGKIR